MYLAAHRQPLSGLQIQVGGMGVGGDDAGKPACHNQLWPSDKKITATLLLVQCSNELQCWPKEQSHLITALQESCENESIQADLFIHSLSAFTHQTASMHKQKTNAISQINRGNMD